MRARARVWCVCARMHVCGEGGVHIISSAYRFSLKLNRENVTDWNNKIGFHGESEYEYFTDLQCKYTVPFYLTSH